MSKLHTNSNPEQDRIQFESEHPLGNLFGYIAGDKEAKAGLVVVQEWWGINDEIKEHAAEIAKATGCVTIVPDLYRGKLAKDHEEAAMFIGSLDWSGAVKDIDGAAKYLREKLGVKKVGVTGFCMGGALTLAACALLSSVNCGSVFYGTPSDKLCDLSTIPTPIQLHFGENDTHKGFADKETVDALEVKLKAGKVQFELYRYADANHGFTNKYGAFYNEQASALATQRLVQFFAKHLH